MRLKTLNPASLEQYSMNLHRNIIFAYVARVGFRIL